MAEITVNAVRGDTVKIPVRATIPVGATARAWMRKDAKSEEYFVLPIVDGKVVIAAAISERCLGNWFYDVEITNTDGTVRTLTEVCVCFKPDITRTFGTELPPFAGGDLERERIVAVEYFKRVGSELVPLDAGSGGATLSDTTYAELMQMIDDGELTPGASYRITDFATVHYMVDLNWSYITDGDGNPIINTGATEPLVVKAATASKLSAEAYSELWPEDRIVYEPSFDAFRNILEAADWDMRPEFVDSEGAQIAGWKGVITRREDLKHHNYVNYDFRAIKYRVWSIAKPAWVEGEYAQADMVQHNGRIWVARQNCETEPGSNDANANGDWVELIDVSDTVYKSFLANGIYVVNLTIAANVDDYIDRTMFLSPAELEGADHGSIDNWFEPCHAMPVTIFGQWAKGNSLGQGASGNSIGQNASYNSLGQNAFGNSFGLYAEANSIGQGASGNSLGQGASGNSLGQYASGNSLGLYASYNSLGQGASYNSLGQGAEANSIGQGASGNSLGYSASGNTLGVYTLENEAPAYARNNHFDDYASNIDLSEATTVMLTTPVRQLVCDGNSWSEYVTIPEGETVPQRVITAPVVNVSGI